MRDLLARVRRRLRVAWLVATAELAAPIAVAVALAFVVAGRMRPWAWPEPAAAAVVALGAIALLIAAVAVRIPALVAARAADRGLGTRDAFAAALELEAVLPDGDPFRQRVKARADRLAAAHRPAEAVPVRTRRRPWVVAAVLALVATGLAFAPNRQDDVRRQQAAERALLREEASRLREAAAAVKKEASASRGEKAVAAELERLARDLEKAGGLERGKEAADQAAARLAAKLDPNLLAQKAAVRGLDRSVESQPLPGAKDGRAADQLAAAAKGLAGLSPEERAAPADRLASLAEAQRIGNPEAAGALKRAADALRNNDLPAAAAAMGEAAAAQQKSTSSVAGQEAAAGALANVGDAKSRLEQGAAAEGKTGQAGQSGQGEGKDGKGKAGAGKGGASQKGGTSGSGDKGGAQAGKAAGEGKAKAGGQGQSQGKGSGGNTGAPSGQVGGTKSPTGSGRGGTGTPDGTGNNASSGLQKATVFDPEKAGKAGEELNAAGNPSDGPSDVVSKEQGLTRRGDTRVPLASVLPRYQAQATRTLGSLNLPPSVRALVRAYFESLAAEDGR